MNLAALATGESTYYSLITRYTAVVAPFMLTAIGYALVRSPTVVRVLIVVSVGVASVTGLVGDYSRNTRWPNLAGAFRDVSHSLARGDAVALTGSAAQGENGDYYLAQLRVDHQPQVLDSITGLTRLKASRVWIVTDPQTASGLGSQLKQDGWTATAVHQFFPAVTVALAEHGQ